MYIFITCRTVDPVSLKSLTTQGVFCSRYSKESEKSQPAKMYPKPGRDHVWFMFFLGLLFIAVREFLVVVAYFVAEHGFSSCGTWA